jgi:hypothetical protein
MFDDPKALTFSNWQDIHQWLTYFWIYFPLIITAAFCALTAHAFIPSLISTGHLSPSAGRLRKPLTIFTVLVLLVAAVLFIRVVTLTLRLDNIWNRYLI